MAVKSVRGTELVVAPLVGEFDPGASAASIRLRRALRDLMHPIDIIVTTPQQVARYRNIQGLIYQSAINDGKVIYERAIAN